SYWCWRARRLITSPRGRGDSGALWASPWPTGMREIYSQQGLRRRTLRRRAECRARTPVGPHGRAGVAPGTVRTAGDKNAAPPPRAFAQLRAGRERLRTRLRGRQAGCSDGSSTGESFGPRAGYPQVMPGKHRRYVFLRILLTDPASFPCRATRCGQNGGPRIRGYLTAVMRRYIPSSPTVGRQPSPWSSTVSRLLF